MKGKTNRFITNEIVNAIQNNVSLPMMSPEKMFGTIGRMVQEARMNIAQSPEDASPPS